MTLGDLMNQCDQYETEKGVEFQIIHRNYDEWDCFDVLWCYSPLLEKVRGCKISSLAAVRENVFRFVLEDE